MTCAAAIREASKSVWVAQHNLAVARKEWVLLKIERDSARAADTPPWRLWDGKECIDCGNYFNFSPITHPRTLEKGIGCNECGASFVESDQKPHEERHGYYTDRRKQTLGVAQQLLAMSEEEFETWETRFGLFLIDTNIGWTPFRPTDWEPDFQ